MFGLLMSLAKSQWHRHFVEALKSSFWYNHSISLWFCQTHCQSKYSHVIHHTPRKLCRPIHGTLTYWFAQIRWKFTQNGALDKESNIQLILSEKQLRKRKRKINENLITAFEIVHHF